MKKYCFISAGRLSSLLGFIMAIVSGVPTVQALTLAEASEKALRANPDLQVFEYRNKHAMAQAETASLRPAYNIGLEAENFAGTGEFSGFDGGEYTLSLSSTIELGGKRDARLQAADSRIAQLQYQRQAQSLALLGEVNRAFIQLLALQEKQKINLQKVDLAEASQALVSRRVNSGAAPEAERLRAQAVLAEARLQVEATNAALERQQFFLANFWGGTADEVGDVSGQLYQFAQPENFVELWKQLESAPVGQQLAANIRWQEAELARAKSNASSDLNWTLGVKQMPVSDDTALVAGISMPLFSASRAKSSINAALAARDIAGSEQSSALLQLRQRLYSAWSQQREYSKRATTLRQQIIPALKEAAKQTKQAYQSGRYSYVDWVSSQRELYYAEINAIDAAAEALANQILIEQLTAQTYASPSTSNKTKD
ncbi:TolC family protein [Gilvimarinus chinensis]|uniref:TolC family protein n=1 Tax=Gilvimarinus chinensis TaxID=396005 RepID=UPI00037CBB4C|nr:TolC family protein [Gilvimarinus chinensis]